MTSLLSLTLGVAMTLALSGYRFGESNHAVYLLEALRLNDPGLLANDWWTRSTLQYHVVFNKLSAWLLRIDCIEPAFLAGYLTLAVAMHVAWRRLTITLGGNDSTYLVSVILFQLMAGGTGLGVYQFLQDSSFLPSNISNVAMLWGMYWWICGRRSAAGLAFGIAGLFHLNHALAGIGLWIGLTALPFLRRRTEPSGLQTDRRLDAAWGIGTVLLVGLSVPAILPAVNAMLHKTASLPLAEFVSLYVRLRHPHHYDPSSWPTALWLTFLIPLALAVPISRAAMRESADPTRRRVADAFSLYLAMLAIALLGAGIFYVSEPLIQMSLYRFSIFPKLLSCIAVAWWIQCQRWGPATTRIVVISLLMITTGLLLARVHLPTGVAANLFPASAFFAFAAVAVLSPRVTRRGSLLFAGAASICVVVSLSVSWHKLGIQHDGFRGDEAGYLEVCAWAREHTPRDAVFLVPPDEQSFRLHARRAIVVNIKNVPQLGSELGEWRDRLETVLHHPDLRTLPHPFYKTLDAVRADYAKQPAENLIQAARQYGARYVVAVRELDAAQIGRVLFSDAGTHYFLYDIEERTPRENQSAKK